MSRRLLLDGEDLASLMLRVRDEMGPDARIVKAERVRTGGIAGFFARERYELTVEVPERPRRLPRRSAPAVIEAGPVPPHQVGDEDGQPGGRPTVHGIDALLAAADAAEAGPPPAAAGLSSAGAVPSPAGAGPSPAVRREPSAAPPSVSTSSQSFADVLGSVRQLVEQDEPDVPEPQDATAPDPQDDATAPQPQADAVPPDRQPQADVVPPDPQPEPDDGDERPGSSVATMLELGIPIRLLAGFDDPQAPVALSQLVRRFERPPAARLTPGSLVVVVGQADLALRTATQMAHRAGLAVGDVLLAGRIEAVPGHGRRVQAPAAAERVRAKASSDAPTLVALGVGEGREAWAEAAELVAAFDPAQVWAAVDARTKAVEQRRWLRAVGARRPVDAVAAVATFEAQAPGTVLNLGLPVGWVDGLPASPVVWAAVLSERLADDAHWE